MPPRAKSWASKKNSGKNPDERIGGSWRANGNQTRGYLLGRTGRTSGSEPGYRHPHVIIQNIFQSESNPYRHGLPLTSNLKRVSAPATCFLKKKRQSSQTERGHRSQVFTVDKSQLAEPIGTLSARRIREIVDGIKLATEPREVE